MWAVLAGRLLWGRARLSAAGSVQLEAVLGRIHQALTSRRRFFVKSGT